ncbi:hypothetical protein BJV82DRAFT_524620 [Fennellomyces sp. T-0311]|nr:hypothetical protein BJV82DRAFT_524620 [Fennellomyces sp. T-0311]
MAVGIGWSLDDDHDFDTLMGTILIGAVLLFLVSLSTTVLPADPALLGIPDDEQHRPPATYFYKPYCLFNEQLSHISEEDASMLQRMASNANTQLPFRSSSHYWANTTTASTTAHNLYDDNDHHLFAEMPSLQLALLPSPPSETPMLVLPIALTSSFNFADPEDEEPDAWPVYSLMLTVFLAGIGSAMMNALLYIYLHDGLGLPMHLIGIIGMVSVASRAASKPLVHWRKKVWVTMNDVMPTRLISGAAFNSLWLIAVRQVDCVLLTAGQHQRMLLRGKMSALFNSLGPALGAALTGYLVDAYVHENIMTFSGFVFAYRGAAAVLAMCWAVSRGWAVVSEDP